MNVTRDEMEEIAARAVKRAFRDMGIEETAPFEMRQDFAFLREWREMCEGMRTRSFLTMLSLVITGLIGLLVLGLKGYFNG